MAEFRGTLGNACLASWACKRESAPVPQPGWGEAPALPAGARDDSKKRLLEIVSIHFFPSSVPIKIVSCQTHKIFEDSSRDAFVCSLRGSKRAGKYSRSICCMLSYVKR